jgi:hypothetical protein
MDACIHGDLFLFDFLRRSECALRELGFAEIRGGLPPRARRRVGFEFGLPW